MISFRHALISDSESSAPYCKSFLAFHPTIPRSRKMADHPVIVRMARSYFRVMPSFSSIISSSSCPSPCAICKTSTYHFLKSIVFSIRRPCTQEPCSLLDTIALILSRCCIIRAVFEHNIRHVNVTARCCCTTLHCRYDASANGTCKVAQVYIADVEFGGVAIALLIVSLLL
jgi:hypothetical protein